MRYLTTFGAAALAVAFLNCGAPCAAQAVPSGSYQQTCRNIDARGSTLYASCENTSGGWQSTQLRDFQRCSGEIQNINGSLQCSVSGNRGYDQGDDQNRGRDADRGRDEDRRRDGDRDQDGNQAYDRGPQGSYIQSCQNVSTNGNTLQASCQKKNGKWRQTSLRNYNRCNRDISNNNGKLQCTR
jgi:CVNH domain